eukprot:6584483-Prymnesium_polylepis.1
MKVESSLIDPHSALCTCRLQHLNSSRTGTYSTSTRVHTATVSGHEHSFSLTDPSNTHCHTTHRRHVTGEKSGRSGHEVYKPTHVSALWRVR